MKTLYILFTLVFSISVLFSFGQTVRLDSSFANSGIVQSSFKGEYNFAQSVVVQSDQKIIVSGFSSIGPYGGFNPADSTYLIRYDQNGVLDQSFGKKGIVATGSGDCYCSAVQTDDKIVVAVGFTLHRFNSNGTIDSSFGQAGMTNANITGDAYAISIQDTGKILVVGRVPVSNGYQSRYHIALAKYNSNGSLDTSFNHGGIAITDIQGSGYAIQDQINGYILVAGSTFDSSSVSNFILMRYNSDGLLDSTFGSNGLDTADFQNGKDIAYAIGIQQNNKILVTGYATIDSVVQIGMIRYDSVGKIDSSFGNEGKVRSLIGKFCHANSIHILNDNKILLGGYDFDKGKYQFVVARYDSNGIPDNTFSDHGISLISIGDIDDEGKSVAIQADGKILETGYSFINNNYDFGLVRCNADGSIDNSFGKQGRVTSDLGSTLSLVLGIVVRHNGKIVVGGSSVPGERLHNQSTSSNNRFAIDQYNSNGTPDSSFGLDGEVRTVFPQQSLSFITALAIQKDDQILADGFEISATGMEYFVLTRYNGNGTLDSTFGSNGVDTLYFGNNIYYPLSLQADGKIVIAGNSFAGDLLFLRYNSNGKLDTSFGLNGKSSVHNSGGCSALTIQEDGKVLAAGSFYAYHNYFSVLRLNPNGSVDSSFGRNGIANLQVGKNYSDARNVLIQSDGKIVVAGDVELDNYSNYALSSLRLNTNGSLDSTFGFKGIAIATSDTDQSYFADNNSSTLQADGKLLACGVKYSGGNNIELVRYDKNGMPDSTFGTGGTIYTPINGNIFESNSLVTLAPDNKIDVAATFSPNYVVARYLNDLTLGIINFSSPNNSALIYPNPIHQTAILKYTLNEAENITISLFDASGKVVRTFIANQNQTKGNYTEQLNFDSDIPAGNYFLVISNGKQKETVKIIKQ